MSSPDFGIQVYNVRSLTYRRTTGMALRRSTVAASRAPPRASAMPVRRSADGKAYRDGINSAQSCSGTWLTKTRECFRV